MMRRELLLGAAFVLPRGFDRHEEGFSWCPWSTDMKTAKLAADLATAEERLCLVRADERS